MVANSHTARDTPEHVDEGALDATLQFGLMLVDAIDAHLAERSQTAAPQAPSKPQEITRA